ncbi:LEA type 2 family protein [Congregibacter brevis]|uniref:LEA type 2 family protein n=1 Tax=Congregibacter brevis TaxID=3081201 RepID=A0ABZ0ICR6_9GAMM|nr:LEA type 2 family protein [Congregibacter sp. IMCC45268]
MLMHIDLTHENWFLRGLRCTAAAILLSLVGCAGMGALDFDEPEVELLGLEPLPSQGLEARFLVKLRIVNPNSIPLAIDGIAYDVSIRGSKVLSGVSNDGISVGAYSESTAELEVAAGMFGSLALVRDLMSNPVDGGLPYKLNAKLSRSGIGGAIRVSKEGTIDLNARP